MPHGEGPEAEYGSQFDQMVPACLVTLAIPVSALREDPELLRHQSQPGAKGPTRDRLQACSFSAIGRPGVNGVGKRNLAILRLLADQALRRGEVVGLDLEDVNLGSDPPYVTIVGKGMREKTRQTISPQVAQALRAWIAERGDWPGPLFTRLDHDHISYTERLTCRSVARITHRLSARASIFPSIGVQRCRAPALSRLR